MSEAERHNLNITLSSAHNKLEAEVSKAVDLLSTCGSFHLGVLRLARHLLSSHMHTPLSNENDGCKFSQVVVQVQFSRFYKI